MPGTASRTRDTISATCVGTPTPMVSASAISNGRASATRRATSTTRSTATSPSNGQPNAAETVTWARIPACSADRAMSSHAAMDSSVETPWFLRLKVSLATTAMPISLQPAATARSNPRRLSTRPMKCVPAGGAPSPCSTASASAICGTFSGWTKLATSMRRRPAFMARRMNSILAAVANTPGSLCRPSRGPTSTMSTRAFMALPVAGKNLSNVY